MCVYEEEHEEGFISCHLCYVVRMFITNNSVPNLILVRRDKFEDVSLGELLRAIIFDLMIIFFFLTFHKSNLIYWFCACPRMLRVNWVKRNLSAHK